jgi:hypothetical protein
MECTEPRVPDTAGMPMDVQCEDYEVNVFRAPKSEGRRHEA